MSKVKLSPVFLLRNWILDTHRDFTRSFLGKVLTILDACVQDKEQRKGIKDLVQDSFYDSFQKRYPDRELRYILADWFEKFCPEMLPKTKEEQDAFEGVDTSPDKPSRFKYFQNGENTPELGDNF